MKTDLRAEVIAIGDEMTSGQRLDTNSQWLSQQLGELGIEVAFHTTVGDDLQDNIDIFGIAAGRADLIVCTGGLGPTADDLTRQAIAEMAGVELEFHEHVLEHIQKMFRRHSREMPEKNRIQAYFPTGSAIIPNPEGTAPGIDLSLDIGDRKSRIFALPGVPYEMKQMWDEYALPAIQQQIGQTGVIHHHVIHCFGTGESQTEEMLPQLTQRGRDPRVGITASLATISLRVTTQAETLEACQLKMAPTLEKIREIMGDFVFGENNVELQEVVAEQLQDRDQTVAIVDLFLKGDVAGKLFEEQERRQATLLRGSLNMPQSQLGNWLEEDHVISSVDKEEIIELLKKSASKIRDEWEASLGIAIGPLFPCETGALGNYHLAISDATETYCVEFSYGGHSKLRHVRSVKQVLNQIRLHLLGKKPVSIL